MLHWHNIKKIEHHPNPMTCKTGGSEEIKCKDYIVMGKCWGGFIILHAYI